MHSIFIKLFFICTQLLSFFIKWTFFIRNLIVALPQISACFFFISYLNTHLISMCVSIGFTDLYDATRNLKTYYFFAREKYENGLCRAIQKSIVALFFHVLHCILKLFCNLKLFWNLKHTKQNFRWSRIFSWVSWTVLSCNIEFAAFSKHALHIRFEQLSVAFTWK